jgi:hypothetical protein
MKRALDQHLVAGDIFFKKKVDAQWGFGYNCAPLLGKTARRR